jgi:hypothetical protein
MITQHVIEKDANSIGYRPVRDSNIYTIRISFIVILSPTTSFWMPMDM